MNSALRMAAGAVLVLLFAQNVSAATEDTPASTAPAAQAASPPGTAPSAPDSVSINGWPVVGKTTAGDVRDKLGQPTMENHADPFHKGQYLWVYAAQDRSMVYTFLFDKDDLVVRMVVYKNNSAQ